jgi:Asp-tRNA(Asn)/Glu-tRNA(Gln) amidotransferase A subunit family amidase
VIVPSRSALPRARDIAAASRRGEVSVVATAEATLERIATVDRDLSAFVAVDADLVLAQARALDAIEPVGPLHGVPVALKDIIDTVDLPTSYGSPIHAGHRPARDAVVVERLRAAGALIVGKTVTTEFALFEPGPTRNPHDRSRTPGGSSSGSAAAVAAGLVPLALGTQTAGSIVRPASFCGVVGVKPTFGLIPFTGVKVCSESLDTLGVLAPDVEDATLALGVMAGVELALPVDPPSRPLRLGWWAGATPMDADAADIVAAAVSELSRRSDVEVSDVALPGWFEELVADQAALMQSEARDALAIEHRDHADRLSPTLRAMLDAEPDARAAQRALDRRPQAQRALAAALEGVDALLTPSVLGEAPLRTSTGDPVLCRTWTLIGAPAIALPGLRGAAGMPLGIQVVGPLGADRSLLGAAHRLAPILDEVGSTQD